MNCPRCGGAGMVQNGSNGVGAPKFLSEACSRQFVEEPKNCSIAQETKVLIDKLLLERIPLAGIARATSVSERWLHYYVNDKCGRTPQRVEIKKSAGHLTAEWDELWLFVAKKKHKDDGSHCPPPIGSGP